MPPKSELSLGVPKNSHNQLVMHPLQFQLKLLWQAVAKPEDVVHSCKIWRSRNCTKMGSGCTKMGSGEGGEAGRWVASVHHKTC